MEEQESRPLLSNTKQILLNAFFFSNSFLWSSLMTVVVPYQIEKAVGDDRKSTAFGLVTAVGALISLFAAPIFGALSDRINLPYGLRKPWLVIGVGITSAFLLMCAYTIREGVPSSIYPFGIGYFFVVLFSNVATAPYAAMIPDIVPHSQRGSASGWVGILSMLGTLFGGLVGFAIHPLGGVHNLYWIIVFVLVFGALCVVFGVEELRDGPETLEPISSWDFVTGLVSPLKNRPFVWVLLVRMCFKLGQSMVTQFMQYFMGDVIGDGNYVLGGVTVATIAAEATGVFSGALLIGAAIISVIAGKMSDRIGRKRIVYGAAISLSILSAIIMFLNTFASILSVGVLVGLGFGAYMGVDYALVTDVLVNEDDYAKDIGIWHTTVPQVIAGGIGGVISDNLQLYGKQIGIDNLGYKAIFAISAISFLFGAISARSLKNNKTTL